MVGWIQKHYAAGGMAAYMNNCKLPVSKIKYIAVKNREGLHGAGIAHILRL